MVAPRPLALVGLMATGKSTVGRLLAGQLHREFVDTDVVIAARSGRSVRELWEAGGEAAYRPLERQVTLEALAAEPPVVIGVPGGAVLDPEVQAALRGAMVIWLRARPETLATRVRPGDHRPLLLPNPLAAFEKMAKDRSDLYRELAQVVLDVDDADPPELCRKIVAALA